MDINKLNQRIGIIGGGQLGKMMAQEAKKMGFFIAVLDPTSDCPAHSLCDYHIKAAFDDSKAITDLTKMCDIVTYEFEHINAVALIKLEKEEGAVIYPSPVSLKVIQDKFKQKKLLQDNNIPVPDFMIVNSLEDMKKAGDLYGFPFMLKTCLGGYDGKGNYVVHNEKDIKKAFEELGFGKIPLMAEKFLNYIMEVSVIACRGINGETKVYPVGRNTHINNILDETYVPAPISENAIKNCMDIAEKVMRAFSGVGIFCVEMFIMDNNDILVNEVAPRPHNSGHYSIEACVTSQFENHIRAIAGLPLGDCSLIRPAVTRNILGEKNADGKACVLGYEGALKIPGAKLHVYGKKTVKPFRKMGHVTVTADDVETAAKLCFEAQKNIKIVSVEEL